MATFLTVGFLLFLTFHLTVILLLHFEYLPLAIRLRYGRLSSGQHMKSTWKAPPYAYAYRASFNP